MTQSEVTPREGAVEDASTEGAPLVEVISFRDSLRRTGDGFVVWKLRRHRGSWPFSWASVLPYIGLLVFISLLSPGQDRNRVTFVYALLCVMVFVDLAILPWFVPGAEGELRQEAMFRKHGTLSMMIL